MSSLRCLWASIGLAAASLLPLAPASAARIRYDFSGTVTDAAFSPGLLGTRFYGSFTYDDDKPPTSSGTNDPIGYDASYFDYGTLDRTSPRADGTGLEVRFADGTTVQSDGLSLFTNTIMRPANSDQPQAWFQARGVDSGRADGTGPDYSVALGFHALKRVIEPGGPIPLDLAVGDFSEAKLYLMGRYIQHPPEWYQEPINVDTPPQVAEGTIDTLSATPVPEPAWSVAALLGAAAWAVRRRARA